MVMITNHIVLFFSTAIAACIKKNSVIEGWRFMPEIKQHGMGTYTSHRLHDFTLTAERPRNWTTGKD